MTGRAISLQEHISAVLHCTAISEVWTLHKTRMAGYGFDKMLYGSTRYKTHGFLGDIEDALLLHAGPQSYLDSYIGEELYLHSPTNDWARNNTGACSWREIRRISAAVEMTAPRRRLMELNAQHGFIAGYVVSMKETSMRGRGAIGLAPRDGLNQDDADAIWAIHGAEIVMLNDLMHLKISTLPQNGQRRPLTSRQREALEWCAQGKTAQDIATIMGLSIATVEKHLRMSREALNAETTAHAVQKATSLNLLFT